MSYTIYRSEGIVLGSASFGEANKYLSIFTREFGLIGVRAQGVRTLQSKLRPHIEDFSIARVGLVHGRDAWRLTNALATARLDVMLRDNANAEKTCAQLCLLLRRLLPPEEPQTALYDEFMRLVLHCVRTPIDAQRIKWIEYGFLVRLLYALGYFSGEEPFARVLEGSCIDSGTQTHVSVLEHTIRESVNNSLRATQL